MRSDTKCSWAWSFVYYSSSCNPPNNAWLLNFFQFLFFCDRSLCSPLRGLLALARQDGQKRSYEGAVAGSGTGRGPHATRAASCSSGSGGTRLVAAFDESRVFKSCKCQSRMIRRQTVNVSGKRARASERESAREGGVGGRGIEKERGIVTHVNCKQARVATCGQRMRWQTCLRAPRCPIYRRPAGSGPGTSAAAF
jgi:hypothetical protein